MIFRFPSTGHKQPAREWAGIEAELWQSVEARLPVLVHLTPEERRKLRALAAEFLTRKEFAGAHDFVVDNLVRLSVALQACLMVLHLGLDYYDDWVGIVVYAGDFIIPRQIIDETGIVHEYDDAVIGEAWQGGPVLLSWFDDDSDLEGVNVVLHEFAHKLDMHNGTADGMPPLPASMQRKAWREAFEPAYADFCRRVDGGEDTLIDPYAAASPAEFFAVASEGFFQEAAMLRNEYPAVYAQLRQFYGQDPAGPETNLRG